MLGLRHNVNLLVDYDPEWAREFSKESKRIADALGGSAKGIEHYGSTAVIGMRAKPIIDILVGVAPFENWEACKAPLERFGYDYAAHAGVPGHHIFGRGRDTTERTHLVHIVAFLGEEWCCNIALRNALRVDEKLRAAYVAEKERAAAAAPEGRRAIVATPRAWRLAPWPCLIGQRACTAPAVEPTARLAGHRPLAAEAVTVADTGAAALWVFAMRAGLCHRGAPVVILHITRSAGAVVGDAARARPVKAQPVPAIPSTRSTIARRNFRSSIHMNAFTKSKPSEVARKSLT
jgi:GrpB-like predicted nucleotidyltransferase (UPF0157 family)